MYEIVSEQHKMNVINGRKREFQVLHEFTDVYSTNFINAH